MDEELAGCVIAAMDGADARLVRHLPYILQDFREIGTSAEMVAALVAKHRRPAQPAVLDLGCGKGAVSVRLAADGCRCLGIDAVAGFVEAARALAQEAGVSGLCTFEVGDIRRRVASLPAFDVIVLGAIGPVFGDHRRTLTTLAPLLTDGGFVVIDDAYTAGVCADTPASDGIPSRSELLSLAAAAGMTLLDEAVIPTTPELLAAYDAEFAAFSRRCLELAGRFPEDAGILLRYVEDQREAYRVLACGVINAVLVFARRQGITGLRTEP